MAPKRFVRKTPKPPKAILDLRARLHEWNVKKHSKKCKCAKCLVMREEQEKKNAAAERKASREARAAKNAQIRAKNQLVTMVKGAVQTCKAAKAAAIEAGGRAAAAAEGARAAADAADL